MARCGLQMWDCGVRGVFTVYITVLSCLFRSVHVHACGLVCGEGECLHKQLLYYTPLFTHTYVLVISSSTNGYNNFEVLPRVLILFLNFNLWVFWLADFSQHQLFSLFSWFASISQSVSVSLSPSLSPSLSCSLFFSSLSSHLLSIDGGGGGGSWVVAWSFACQLVSNQIIPFWEVICVLLLGDIRKWTCLCCLSVITV